MLCLDIEIILFYHLTSCLFSEHRCDFKDLPFEFWDGSSKMEGGGYATPSIFIHMSRAGSLCIVYLRLSVDVGMSLLQYRLKRL